jgi:hypothetical protein
MKYIANILTDKKFTDSELYNVVNSKDKLIGDIPTLIIGWGYTKKMYPEANILDWKINDNIFWTYGKREKRNKYEENIDKFKKLSINKFIKSVKYQYYNLLTISEEEKRYIISLLCRDCKTHIYINCDMVYIFDDENNIVIGFSLRDIDYINNSRKKMFNIILRNKNNNVIDIKDTLSYDMKISLNECKYVIPYLYS